MFLATSALQFPKEHQFNCLDTFNNGRCTKYTLKVFVYDGIINKCVKKHWSGCPTGNMFYDADNCNNACKLCIYDEGDTAEFMDLKYFTETLSPENKTVFYQALNTLEGQLRTLAGRNSFPSRRTINAVEFQDDSESDIHNENDHDRGSGNEKEDKNDDDQEEDNNDDNWEDENSEWDIK